MPARNGSFAANTPMDTPAEQLPNPYDGVPMDEIDPQNFAPVKYYRLPADPWHIICRWRKDGKLSAQLNSKFVVPLYPNTSFSPRSA